MSDMKITGIEIVSYEYEVRDLGTDYNGFNLVYEGGAKRRFRSGVLRILTDTELAGE